MWSWLSGSGGMTVAVSLAEGSMVDVAGEEEDAELAFSWVSFILRGVEDGGENGQRKTKERREGRRRWRREKSERTCY